MFNGIGTQNIVGRELFEEISKDKQTFGDVVSAEANKILGGTSNSDSVKTLMSHLTKRIEIFEKVAKDNELNDMGGAVVNQMKMTAKKLDEIFKS